MRNPKKQMADEFKNTVESEPIDSKALIEAIMEHIPAGMAIADARDLSVPMVSKFGLDLIGHSKEKTPGSHAVNLRDSPSFFILTASRRQRAINCRWPERPSKVRW